MISEEILGVGMIGIGKDEESFQSFRAESILGQHPRDGSTNDLS